MNWNNTQKMKFPNDQQEVFIIVDGINYTATYNELEKSFTVKNMKSIIFSVDKKTIFWAEMDK